MLARSWISWQKLVKPNDGTPGARSTARLLSMGLPVKLGKLWTGKAHELHQLPWITALQMINVATVHFISGRIHN
jgi:hypothetical protein